MSVVWWVVLDGWCQGGVPGLRRVGSCRRVVAGCTAAGVSAAACRRGGSAPLGRGKGSAVRGCGEGRVGTGGSRITSSAKIVAYELLATETSIAGPTVALAAVRALVDGGDSLGSAGGRDRR